MIGSILRFGLFVLGIGGLRAAEVMTPDHSPTAPLRSRWSAKLGLGVVDGLIVSLACASCYTISARSDFATHLGPLRLTDLRVGTDPVSSSSCTTCSRTCSTGRTTWCQCSGASMSSTTPTSTSTCRRRRVSTPGRSSSPRASRCVSSCSAEPLCTGSSSSKQSCWPARRSSRQRSASRAHRVRSLVNPRAARDGPDPRHAHTAA